MSGQPPQDRPPRRDPVSSEATTEAWARDPQGGLLIDVRGPRFSAAITSLIVALALVIQEEPGIALVAFQTLVFAVAAFAGLRWSPYGNLFRFLKRRLNWGPPPAVEPEGPPRFSQLLGFLMTAGALLAFAAGARLLGWVLVGFVLAAAVLLALTGL